MTDTTVSAEATTPEGEKPAEETAPKPVDAPEQEQTDWKARSRLWESRAKENAEAAKKLAELEDAKKSAEEKQAEALAKAQAELEGYKKREQVSAWAKEIVKDSGVPADALRGDSEEELQAHFEQLKSLITPAESAKAESDPVPGIGDQPAGSGNVTIGEQIRAAEKSGDKALVASLKAMLLTS